MKPLIAALGLAGLLGCAHLPKTSAETPLSEITSTYFITEAFCDSEKTNDYKKAERLREKYLDSTLIVLSPHTSLSEVEDNYHGKVKVLSGFYDTGKINQDLLRFKINEAVPKGSLVFLMSHGDPKLAPPNMEVCPWNGWQEVKRSSPEETDERMKRDGAYLTETDFSGSRVYPLNCSAHPQYMLETELDVVVDDILRSGVEAPYVGKRLKDSYITDRTFLEEIEKDKLRQEAAGKHLP